MQEEIFARIKESKKESKLKYMKLFGEISDEFDEESLEIIIYKNKDLKMILSKFELIEDNDQNMDLIEDFYEKIYTLSIGVGIKRGKRLVINVMKEGKMDFSKIMAVETGKFSNIEIEPDIVGEFRKSGGKESKSLRRQSASLKHFMAIEFSDDEHEIISELKTQQLDVLIEDLKISREDFEKLSKKIIRIRRNSGEYPFESDVYGKHNGNYKFETLIYQYLESVIREGMIVGMQFGKKFMIRDLQNHRFSREDVENMSEKEIEEYCDEVVEDIWG